MMTINNKKKNNKTSAEHQNPASNGTAGDDIFFVSNNFKLDFFLNFIHQVQNRRNSI
jgi:hypothetical protein